MVVTRMMAPQIRWCIPHRRESVHFQNAFGLRFDFGPEDGQEFRQPDRMGRPRRRRHQVSIHVRLVDRHLHKDAAGARHLRPHGGIAITSPPPYPRSFSIPYVTADFIKRNLLPCSVTGLPLANGPDINEARLRAKLAASRVKPVKA